MGNPFFISLLSRRNRSERRRKAAQLRRRAPPRKRLSARRPGALPNRRNVVLSRSVKELPGCDVYPSLDEALANCAPDEDVYIIGGASV
ncbi:MAG: dihydrofolate reductase, partial [Clostridia bacterium]|nr:dihydrofolate reductase [Clostridia bacterium]